jgi:hypothetical protein
MANVPHALNPSMMSALATHFKNLDPRPIGGAPKQSVSTGMRIYEDGIPEANVPACSACHGADGHGQNEIPRLAGQLYEYMVSQLTGWAKVRGVVEGGALDVGAAIACRLSRPGSGMGRGLPCPQLHLVPWNVRAGLYGGAATGGTAAALYRKPDPKLS